MSRTGRTPIDDNAVYGDLDKSEREVISGQFLTIHSHISKMVYFGVQYKLRAAADSLLADFAYVVWRDCES